MFYGLFSWFCMSIHFSFSDNIYFLVDILDDLIRSFRFLFHYSPKLLLFVKELPLDVLLFVLWDYSIILFSFDAHL